MSLTNKEIVQQVNNAFADFSTENFLVHCADDITWTTLGAEKLKGKDAIKNFLDDGPQCSPVFEIIDTIAEENKVVSYGNMQMKNKDDVNEDYSFCDVYTLHDERIVELTSYLLKTSKA